MKVHQEYDVIVVGCGITGAGTARDCSMRGLKTLLIERHDFTAGRWPRSPCGKVLLSPQGARKTLKRSWICCKHLEVKKKSLPLQHDWIKAALSKEIKRYSAPNSEYLLFLRHIAVSLSRGTYSVKPKRVLQISLNGNGAKLIHYENIATAFADASYRSWSL